MFVHGDASGDAEHPAVVTMALFKGALRLGPGSSGAPLVAGSIRAGDSTLLPHVTVNSRGVAIVQDFAPDDGLVPDIGWDLALGSTPMRLFVHVIGSEEQHIDLGGRRITTARLYNEGGHLALDWSAQNPQTAQSIELWSIGYLDARHLARSGAKRIEIKNVGLALLDVGDRVDADLRVDVVASAGTFVLTLPAGISARATLDAPASVRIEALGWAHEAPGPYTLGPIGLPPRVMIAIKATVGLVQLLTSQPGPS